MPRRLLRFASHSVAVVSALVSIAALILWARSYCVSDVLGRTSFDRHGNTIERRGITVSAGEGGLAWEYFAATEEVPREAADDMDDFLRRQVGGTRWGTYPARHPLADGLTLNWWTPPKTRPTSVLNRLGFYGHFSRRPAPATTGLPVPLGRESYTNANLLAPLWFVVAVTAILPGWRLFRRWLRERRVLAGHCPSCGYDVRATPGVCPECGRDPTTAAPPRLVLHSPALAASFRGATLISAVLCAYLVALWLYAVAVRLVAPMERGAAAQLFQLNTYVPALPPFSLLTLILLAALPPAARLAASGGVLRGRVIRQSGGNLPDGRGG